MTEENDFFDIEFGDPIQRPAAPKNVSSDCGSRETTFAGLMIFSIIVLGIICVTVSIVCYVSKARGWN